MAIDLSAESVLTLTEAAQILPSRPDVSTLWRWRTKGVKGVILETLTIGGRRFTTHEALDRFIVATTLAASTGVTPTSTPADRQRALAQADAILAKAGI